MYIINTRIKNIYNDLLHLYYTTTKTLQSNQVKRAPQNAINEFIIRKLSPLAVVDFRFISIFLHS